MRESRGKSILLVEDNASVADALVLLLVEAGYHVEVWVQGAKFSLQRPFPDLILLDLLLGSMDGQTICQQLKGRGTTRRIPVILMSANQQTPQIAKDPSVNNFLFPNSRVYGRVLLLMKRIFENVESVNHNLSLSYSYKETKLALWR